MKYTEVRSGDLVREVSGAYMNFGPLALVLSAEVSTGHGTKVHNVTVEDCKFVDADLKITFMDQMGKLDWFLWPISRRDTSTLRASWLDNEVILLGRM